MQIIPFVMRLEQQLQSLENQVIELLNASTIKRYPDRSYDPFYEPEVIVLMNSNYWGDDNGSLKHLQLKLLRSYSSWFERFQMLFHDSSEEIQRQIRDTHKNIREWIE